MANPTILIDSATGSDTAASGAGPATALTGSAASTSSDGLTVTLDGSPDLTNVDTTGLHVIFLNDSTANNRNFGKITGKDNTAKTVTVANAFGLSLSGKSWAIGGKRATLINNANSRKLISNNSGNGDAMPGWIMEMASGHGAGGVDTFNAVIAIARSGDTTDGPTVIRGAPGAATLPILSWSANAGGFAMGNARNYWHFVDFEMQNTNGTKTLSTALSAANANHMGIVFRGIKVSNSTNNWWKGLNLTTQGNIIENCEIGYTTNIGVTSSVATTIINSYIHDCGSHGISLAAASVGGSTIIGNIITNNGGDGINDARTISPASLPVPLTVTHNTIAGNAGDGYEATHTSAQGGLTGASFDNNIISSNGGYAFNFSGSGFNETQLWVYGGRIRNNDLYNNTSGNSNLTLTSLTTSGTVSVDPGFTSAAGGDYSVGTSVKALGYPLGGTNKIGNTSATYSYVDIGAAQRQESGGSGPTYYAY